jgi:hypothetical protein
MPKYVEVKGQVIEFPDEMAPADIEAAIKKNMMSIPPEKPAAVQAGGMLNEIPRQLGLTARYGIEGLANTAQMFTEPLRQVVTDPLVRLVTGDPNRRSKPLGQVATDLADSIGLPSPKNANERVVADATRLVAGSGGVIKGAQAASNLVGGTAQKVLSAMAVNPVSQLTAAAGGGLGQGASREAGGTAIEQFGGALFGTLAGGMAPGAINSVAQRISAMRASPMQLEGKITVALREAGVDYSQLPKNIRDGLVSDVRKAMSAGDEINPDALRRLADFRLTNTTPTRGMVTLDPLQITREQNLAKMGANSNDQSLQGLARVQNDNNARLIQNLNRLGASEGNVDAAGNLVTSSVASRQAQLRAAEQAAWDAAKQSPGYRQPISSAVISDINQALGDEALMPFMNPTISKYMEAFQKGQPFTPQDYRNLQSMLSREIAKGGNEGAAARLAQRVLERADLSPMTSAPGPGLVTARTAGALRAEDAAVGASADAIDAVNQARAATRAAYAYEDSSPLVRSVLSESATSDPQRIAQRFVVGGTTAEARTLAQEVGPQGIGTVKNALLAHLKNRALNGAADEVGKFSQSAFNKALREIGDEKLRLFFSPEEIAALQANGRVASYMQVQPVGSAVNNSNSGALIAQKAQEWLSMIPGGKMLVADPLQSMTITLGQRQAQNVAPSLLMPPSQRFSASTLLGPSVAAGGLLAAPGPVSP